MNRKLDVIQAGSKAKENQPLNQSASKEEIEAIVKEKTDFLGHYFEYKHKIQTEQNTKIMSAIRKIEEKIDALPVQEKNSFEPVMKLFPQPKKVTICGFEFLKTSFIIFVLSVAIFWSLVMNIKQIDNYQALKAQLYQQTEYILHLEKGAVQKQ